MKAFKNQKTLKRLSGVSILLVGNVGLAAGVEFFIVPNDLMSGGVAGIGLFVQTLFPTMRLSLFTFIVNLLLLVVGFFFLGKNFTLTTTLSSVCYPAAMAVMEFTFKGMVLTENSLLSAIFAGLLTGLSMGLIIRQGASTGGLDIPVLIVHKYTSIPVSFLVYVFDFIILVLQAFSHPAESFLYAALMLLISSFTMDKILLAGQKKIQMKIISQKQEEIRKAIIEKVDRGVTVLYGETGYLHEPLHMLVSVMSRREVAKLRKIIDEIDDCAFIMISEVSEVRGRGFTIEDANIPKKHK